MLYDNMPAAGGQGMPIENIARPYHILRCRLPALGGKEACLQQNVTFIAHLKLPSGP